MEMTGAKALIESLKKEGVDVLFGYPGGTVLPIYDELYKEKAIRNILTRHEQGAAHAADGYARATGKVGVCLATSGPGATNLITGIATANMDSVPMVAITGQVGTPLIGKDSFQEADITGITMPITKHNYLIKSPEEIPRVIKEAFHIARSGRPGVVVVDIAKDAQMKTLKNFKYPDKVNIPSYRPTTKGHPKQISAAVKLIQASKRPVLYVGGGIIAAGANKELKEFAEKNNIPVTVTLMGKGAFPGNSKLYLGMLGMHGTAYANYAVQEADLLIAVGARFDDRVTGHLPSFAPKAKHIHIDIDPAEIGKIVQVDVPIVGDCKNVLVEFLAKVSCKDKHEQWIDQINEWKKKYPLSYKTGKTIKPQYVVERVCELTKDKKVIIATEVGQHQMWAAQFFTFKKPRTLISSGGQGTMGFGFPAAIGAQIGVPDAIVIDIAGDGSIQMNIQELATAVINKIPVKIFVLNNSFLGMVRQWQEIIYDKRYAATNLCSNPDLVKIAKAYGAEAFRVEKPGDVDKAIRDALKIKGPVLVDFVVEKEENVFPFVLAGKPINEMLID